LISVRINPKYDKFFEFVFDKDKLIEGVIGKPSSNVAYLNYPHKKSMNVHIESFDEIWNNARKVELYSKQ
jgi:hypothetical protein